MASYGAPQPGWPHPRGAFTLIELLVVIGILGLLAVILVPALGRMLARGKSAHCLSNLKQLHVLTCTYVADHGKYPVMGIQADPSDPTTLSNREEFYHNFGNQRICACPAAKFQGKNFRGSILESYGSNPMVMPYRYVGSQRIAVREHFISRTSEVVLLADSPQFASGPRRVLPYAMAWWINPSRGKEATANVPLTEDVIPENGFWDDIPLMPRRHADRANLVFVDGHTTSIGATAELKERNYYWNY